VLADGVALPIALVSNVTRLASEVVRPVSAVIIDDSCVAKLVVDTELAEEKAVMAEAMAV
jgi:hypothetical protein